MSGWHVRQHGDRIDFTLCMIVFKCSDGSHLHLPGLGTDQKCSDSRPPHIWSSTPFDFGFTQCLPHPHHHHPACSARQTHSCRNGDSWDRWIVQIHRHNAHESCTFYTVSSLLLSIGPWVGGNPATSIFLGVLREGFSTVRTRHPHRLSVHTLLFQG